MGNRATVVLLQSALQVFRMASIEGFWFGQALENDKDLLLPPLIPPYLQLRPLHSFPSSIIHPPLYRVSETDEALTCKMNLLREIYLHKDVNKETE